MIWTVAVALKDPLTDPKASAILRDASETGVGGISGVQIDRMYRLNGTLGRADIDRVVTELLCDPVVDSASVSDSAAPEKQKSNETSVEVGYNPGVTDPVENSVLKAVSDMGLLGLESVSTGHRYRFTGSLSQQQAALFVEQFLMNPVIQHQVLPGDAGQTSAGRDSGTDVKVRQVDLLNADDQTLLAISKDGGLSLNLIEMQTIRDHYSGLGRNPTDVELETLAQTWSEHCVHKTFKGKIEYEGEVIDNLLKHTVVKATFDLDLPWCVSVFVDNAGIVEFDDDWHLCFKVETHNHPSAVEPYGGAGTGIGGVIRDILGAGLGAKPVANTDVFCFGPPDFPRENLPEGVLHPRQVFRGVVGGVRDYGNRMGIPTVNGAVLFDEGYLGNPIVYCGTVGIMPVGTENKEVNPDRVIVVVGGRTGRDGIHGATLSSADLDSDADTIWSTAVQIGNPITEKKMLDVLLRARDLGMYEGITDCGAGGLSSAVGEMGEKCGAEVDLETVPLKYDGLTYTEIWISEAQERMVLSVPTDKLDELLNLFDSEDVEATPIGRFTDSGRLVLRYQGVQVADMEMGFLHDGVPQTVRKAVWAPPATSSDSHLDQPGDLTHSLSSLLSTENIASKEWVIRQYDHEVQGTSVIKPLVGASNDGPSDAAVIRPVLSSYKGVAISNGINPHYGLLDPYHMATLAIDEAVRQIIAVGGRRDRTAILDNFCWGNPEDSQRLGEFVRAAKGCHDGALAFETPFISGKDSFYNEFNTDDSTIAIPPTLLISAVSVMDDARLAVSMDFKAPGDLVYIVGDTRDEMGGSHYYMLHNELGTDVPQVDLERAPQIMDALTGAIENGLVRACHDCSEGGLGVAIAEMAFAGEIGVDVDLARVVSSDSTDRDDHLLFSESPTRFIVEIAPNDRNCFEATLSGFPFSHMGDTNDSDSLAVVGTRGKTVVAADIFDLKEAWQAPLRSV